jgi:hypothetical protein
MRAKGGADKKDCEVLAIESLAQIPVKITPLNHELAFYCDMVPDSGAMVTAIPACQAKGIELYHTDVVLRNAGGVELKTLGVFEACIGLQSLSVIDTIFVVRGLSQPLLSRSIMKELGLLHPKFPHQLTPPEKADEEASPSGIVQMLAVEGRPLTTEPKKVQFGPPLEPDHISESEMSDDEDDPHHNKSNAVEQVHGPTTQGYQAQARGSASLRPKRFKKTHRAPPKGGFTPHRHPDPRRCSTAHF